MSTFWFISTFFVLSHYFYHYFCHFNSLRAPTFTQTLHFVIYITLMFSRFVVRALLQFTALFLLSHCKNLFPKWKRGIVHERYFYRSIIVFNKTFMGCDIIWNVLKLTLRHLCWFTKLNCVLESTRAWEMLKQATEFVLVHICDTLLLKISRSLGINS